MRSEYLLFNLVIAGGTFFATLLFRRYSHFPKPIPTLRAIFLSASIFVLMDLFVTNVWWYFNPRFTLGILVGSLPVEEILFFITVPLACLQLWINVKRFYVKKLSSQSERLLTLCLWAILLCLFLIHYALPYTRMVIIALACIPILDRLLKTHLMRSWVFIVFVAIITNTLTFIWNGYLTARPIVTYNPLMKTQLMVLTVPFEDFMYGMVLISLVIILYEYFSISHTSKPHTQHV